MILLDKTQILSNLRFQPDHIYLFNAIDSTNTFLNQQDAPNYVDICCAEMQTQGRGRFGRHWHSPFAEHIYCSSRWRVTISETQLSGLPLAISLSILNALHSLNIRHDIQVKWPNDLLWRGKKLCGNLIEMHRNPLSITIGIGLNVHNQTHEQPWCSLDEITGQIMDRNQLISAILNELHQTLLIFCNDGFLPFMTQWQKVDGLANQTIDVRRGNEQLRGIASGVTDQGSLILIDEHNNTHYLHSGEVTLRKSERGAQ